LLESFSHLYSSLESVRNPLKEIKAKKKAKRIESGINDDEKAA